MDQHTGASFCGAQHAFSSQHHSEEDTPEVPDDPALCSIPSSHAERTPQKWLSLSRFIPSLHARKRTRIKRRIKIRAQRFFLLILQLAILIAVYELGVLIAQFLPIDLPGNIVGMALLLILLATGMIKHRHVGRACDYLIDNMSIFFIPAGVGIMGCFGLLAGSIAKFAFVCVVTTILVFLATSWTVICTQRLLEAYNRRKHTSSGLTQTQPHTPAPHVPNAQ